MYPPEMMVEVTVDGASIVAVSVDQLRRGVTAGRVPTTAHVRPVGSTPWLPIQSFLHAPPPQGYGTAGPSSQGYPPSGPASWGQGYAPQGYPPQGYPPPGGYGAQHGGYGAPGYPAQGGYAQSPAFPQAPPAPVSAQAPPPSVSMPVPAAAVPAAPSPAYLAELQSEIAKAEARLAEARKGLESVEESLEIQSFGFYKARYGFGSSEEYTRRLKVIREKQKEMIRGGKATVCSGNWTVDGSAAEGRKMVARQSKLMLRAFNGECDAAIAKVRYDNVVVLEQRIGKACSEISGLGESNRIEITNHYLSVKLEELFLVHEHREKVQEEKEEQRRIREAMREEQKAQEEIERAQAEAEKEEERSEKALEKARAELAESTGKQHDRLEALVNKLETELKDAIDRKAKAIARAQLTKSGHVYILSNIGSFGEGVYKIGMTRRLEPLERVDELGDASVPFPFDVHAIIYCEDAPKLENALHRAFAHRRVNRVNQRKEYFRVTLDEVREEVAKVHGLVTFLLDAEAEQWRKTVALMEEAGASNLQ